MLVTITQTPTHSVTLTSNTTNVTLNCGTSSVTLSNATGPRGADGDGVTSKVAVSGDVHPTYGQLTMSNNNTEALIPGSGAINSESLIVSVKGNVETDFTLSGRTITLGFSPDLSNRNRMVVQYADA